MQGIAELIDIVRTKYAVVLFWIPLATLLACNPGKNFVNVPDFSLVRLYMFVQASSLLMLFGLTASFSHRVYNAAIERGREATWRLYVLWPFSLVIGLVCLGSAIYQTMSRVSGIGAFGVVLATALVSVVVLWILIHGPNRRMELTRRTDGSRNADQ